MSLKTRLLIIAVLFGGGVLTAQVDSLDRKIRYYNTFMSGTLVGCGECVRGQDFNFSFVTFHGLSLKSGIKAGVGAGLDVYNDWRMYPLLAAFTIDKGRRRNALYLHINSGYSFGTYLPQQDWGEPIYDDKGGFTISPMIGLRLGRDKMRVYMQAGYKYQHSKVSADFQNWWGWLYSYSRAYDLNRFVFQFGFGIN